MKLRFLCAGHRNQLSLNPGQAINCWQNSFDTGQLFYEQAMWEDALPHIGCAFETAEIILTTKAVDTPCACELFMSSAILLAKTYMQLGYREQILDVYEMAVYRLQREMVGNSIKVARINRNLVDLHKNFQGLIERQDSAVATSPLEAAQLESAVH